jgi:hypothetical protein
MLFFLRKLGTDVDIDFQSIAPLSPTLVQQEMQHAITVCNAMRLKFNEFLLQEASHLGDLDSFDDGVCYQILHPDDEALFARLPSGRFEEKGDQFLFKASL